MFVVSMLVLQRKNAIPYFVAEVWNGIVVWEGCVISCS